MCCIKIHPHPRLAKTLYQMFTLFWTVCMVMVGCDHSLLILTLAWKTILMSVLENMQVITCCSGMFWKWLTWRCNSLTKLRNLSNIKKFGNYDHIKCNIVHASITRNRTLFFGKVVIIIIIELKLKNKYTPTVKKLLNKPNSRASLLCIIGAAFLILWK